MDRSEFPGSGGVPIAEHPARREEAERVIQEVIGYLQETPETYVRRRHRALQGEGLSNAAIYAQLASELSAWRFRAPDFSERQIRRMIYG